MKNILSLLILFVSFNATAQYSYATANKAKKFAKTRPDDFMPEISMLNNFLKYKNKNAFIKNLSLDYGLKAASICARVFENNK